MAELPSDSDPTVSKRESRHHGASSCLLRLRKVLIAHRHPHLHPRILLHPHPHTSSSLSSFWSFSLSLSKYLSASCCFLRLRMVFVATIIFIFLHIPPHPYKNKNTNEDRQTGHKSQGCCLITLVIVCFFLCAALFFLPLAAISLSPWKRKWHPHLSLHPRPYIHLFHKPSFLSKFLFIPSSYFHLHPHPHLLNPPSSVSHLQILHQHICAHCNHILISTS